MILTRRRATSATAGSASKGKPQHNLKQRQQQPIPESEGGAAAQKARVKTTDQDERSGRSIGARPLLLGAVMVFGSIGCCCCRCRCRCCWWSGRIPALAAAGAGGARVRADGVAVLPAAAMPRGARVPARGADPGHIIGNWNPDDVAIPARHHSTLCRIDYQAEWAKAFRYRDAEVPFVVYNVPEFDETVRKWAQPGYLARSLGPDTKQYPVETSRSNHFTYVAISQEGRDVYEKATRKELPLRRTEWSYARWVDEGHITEQAKASGVPARQLRHGYLYAADDLNGAIEEELTIFSRANASLFVADPARLNLIECRFAMKGIVTEAHFDRARNMAGAVSGLQRWILAHPRNCPSAHLRPNDDLSARQSLVDFAEPDLEKYPDFAKMEAHEVVLMPGEVLHIPPFWLHYVVTLETGAQCNAQCGFSTVGQDDIEACGFKQPPIRPPRGGRLQQRQRIK